MTTRIGIAGLGLAGRTIHVPAYAAMPAVELVGGCDPVAPAHRLPFPVFPSLDELLRATAPDVLVVATPPDSHHDLVREGLEHGCHVLCEKPFVPSLEEAHDLVERARRASRRVAVNQEFRFMNIHLAAKRRLGTAEFGELRFLDAQQTFLTTAHTETGWRGRDRRRTCQEFGTHVLDLCRFFFDDEPTTITARMPGVADGDGRDLLNLIDLEFPGGRLAHLTLDRWSRGRNRYLDLRLDGTTGCVETHIGGDIVLSAGIRGGRRRPFVDLDVALGGYARLYRGERFTRIATDPLRLFVHATRRLMGAFLTALAQRRTPPCDAEDNVRTLGLVLAAYDSAERGTTIEVGP